MPTVPNYDDQRIKSRPLPKLQFSSTPKPDAFGGGASLDRVDSAAQGLFGAWAKNVEKEQMKADKIRYDQSRNSLNAWERENIYDPENGAARTVGEEAFEIDKRLRDSYEKFTTDERKKLSTERQRVAFDGLVNERWDHVDRWAKQHISQQIDILGKTTRAAKIESSKERVVLDPSTLPMELQQIGEAVQEDMHGQSPEAISAKLLEHETDLHARVLNSFLSSGNDAAARRHYDTFENRIDPDRRASLQEKINIASERIERENTEKMEIAALNVIENTKDFDSLPKATIEALPRESRVALRSYARMLERGDAVKTDIGTYYELIGMPDEEFKKVNLLEMRDRLSDSHFIQLSKMQRKVKTGGKDQELDGFRSDAAVVDDSMRSAGLDPARLKKRDREVYGQFRSAVEQRQMALQSQTGKKATNEDIKRISDELIRSGRVEGSGWNIPVLGITFGGENKYAFQLQPGEKIEGAADVPTVTTEEQYRALRPGQKYMDASGVEYRKK